MQDRDFSELNTFFQVGCPGKEELGNSFSTTAWPCWISGQEMIEEMVEWISSLWYHLKDFCLALAGDQGSAILESISSISVLRGSTT